MLIGVFGKGGVGKTTISLSIGLLLGKAKIITTDPYPGLLELLPNPPRDIELKEISYEELREEWKKEFGEEALNIFRSLADLNEDFLDYLSTAPGLIEQYAVYRVVKEHVENPSQIIIWDTQGAPGVMSLIRSELEFYNHLRKAPLYWTKLKKILTREIDIESIIQHWRQIAELTINEMKKTKTIIVVNPDKLSIKIGQSLGVELSQYTDFRGYILNKDRSNKKIQVIPKPLLATIPELEDPEPRQISRYVESVVKEILYQ